MTVVQDAWTRIRHEHSQHLSAASTDEGMAELARTTQMQLRSIVQDCTDSVLQLRSSMNEDLEDVRCSIEAFQEQLGAMKSSQVSQAHERSAETVTPQILAAAVAAIQRHVDEYFPCSFQFSQFWNVIID